MTTNEKKSIFLSNNNEITYFFFCQRNYILNFVNEWWNMKFIIKDNLLILWIISIIDIIYITLFLLQ